MTGETIIYYVDDRSSFRRDEHYPNLILLYTVLRWAVTGNVIDDHDAEQIIKNNNKALASTAAWLADKIESGVIPIFSVHTLQPIGTAEMNPILSRLHSMERSNNVEGLADEDGRDYYLGGWQLVKEYFGSVANINDDQKGGVWKMLMRDTPAKWRTAQTTNELGPVEAMPVMLTEGPKPWEIVDPRDPAPKYRWYTPARYLARQFVIEDPTLLIKRDILAEKVTQSLTKMGINKRGGKKPFDHQTIKKAFSNVILG